MNVGFCHSLLYFSDFSVFGHWINFHDLAFPLHTAHFKRTNLKFKRSQWIRLNHISSCNIKFECGFFVFDFPIIVVIDVWLAVLSSWLRPIFTRVSDTWNFMLVSQPNANQCGLTEHSLEISMGQSVNREMVREIPDTQKRS